MPKRLLLASAFSLALLAGVYAQNDDPINLVKGSDGCRKFGRVDDDTLAPLMRWLAGYRDGVAALAALDKRLLRDWPQDPLLLGALVLSLCHAKPDRSIGEVANELIEMLVFNKKQGRPSAPGGAKQ